MIAAALACVVATASSADWPQWSRFTAAFISEDGRVHEPSMGDRTTSEGQAYGLFFALVAGDRARFERILGWTDANLAGGGLGATLPGWEWGRDKKGKWRVLDRNSASDADLWLGYTLLEAGRLWGHERYTALGEKLLAAVVKREVIEAPSVGALLLPGPHGFVKKRSYRLNPSYLPLFISRRLAALGVPGPWADLPATTVRMIRETTPHGFVADWLLWDSARGFTPSGTVGSYDAIRVYLWAAMLPDGEPLRAALREAIGGPARFWHEHGRLPEKIDVTTGRDVGRTAPPGFYAVMLAAATASGDRELAAGAAEDLEAACDEGLYAFLGQPRYYDQVLALFARGFVEGRFRFRADGSLQPRWE